MNDDLQTVSLAYEPIIELFVTRADGTVEKIQTLSVDDCLKVVEDFKINKGED